MRRAGVPSRSTRRRATSGRSLGAGPEGQQPRPELVDLRREVVERARSCRSRGRPWRAAPRVAPGGPSGRATSASRMPRCSTSRATATSGSTSTTTSAAMSSRPDSTSSGHVQHHEVVGVGLGLQPAGDLHAHRRVHDVPEVLRAPSGSLKTRSATAWRSSVPSAATIPAPKRSTIAANTSVPGCCSSRVMASASMITAPLAARRADTVDLPDADAAREADEEHRADPTAASR